MLTVRGRRCAGGHQPSREVSHAAASHACRLEGASAGVLGASAFRAPAPAAVEHQEAILFFF